MTDTPNPAGLASMPLASAREFDERLKRTDEDRWLATRYAPAEGRQRLVAVYLLNQELQRALQAREPMLAKIRIQWWRETLEGFGGNVRRHDLSLELARVSAGRADLVAAMQALIDRYDDIADDHLAGGHSTTAEHEAAHYAAEVQLAVVAGLALRAQLSAAEREALGKCGEAHLARRAGMNDVDARWAAAKAAVRKLPADLWPAVAHLAAVDAAGPLGKRWGVFRAVLSRSL